MAEASNKRPVAQVRRCRWHHIRLRRWCINSPKTIQEDNQHEPDVPQHRL